MSYISRWGRRLRLFLCCVAMIKSLHLILLSPTLRKHPSLTAPLILTEGSLSSHAPQLVPPDDNVRLVVTDFTSERSGENKIAGRRLFLGIFTSPAKDGRLRNVIRKTYLARESNKDDGSFAGGSLLPSICSLADFAREFSIDPDYNSCQVVYSFVSPGNPRDTFSGETDVLHLNLTGNTSSGVTRKSFNRVHSLYRYLLSFNLKDHNVPALPFDFVAYTHTRVLIYPTRLWPPDMFWSDARHPSIYDQPKLYSGVVSVVGNTTIGSTARGSKSLFQDYVLLSRNLLKTVLRTPFHRRVKDELTEAKMEQIIIHAANTREVNSTRATQLSSDTTVLLPIRNSVHIVEESRYNYMGFLQRWDNYKDAELVTYEDEVEEARVRSNPRIRDTLGTCRHGPRLLLGIFTVKDDDLEHKRRQMIRDTYLSYFRLTANETSQHKRICPLSDLLSNHTELLRECQLVYTFVAGGKPDGPTERVEFSDSEPLTLSTPGEETDIVTLNIRENLKEGKSQSFFKYATAIADDYVYFDYFAKTDTDTLIFPERILDIDVKHLAAFPENVRVYGGAPRAKVQIDHLKGPVYNVGAFYWMSVDLARYITSPECDRDKLKVFSEDKSIGNFVHSHPLPIRRVKMNMFPKHFEHPVKNIHEFRALWDHHVTNTGSKRGVK